MFCGMSLQLCGCAYPARKYKLGKTKICVCLHILTFHMVHRNAMVPCNACTYLHSVYSIRVLCAFHFQFIVAGSLGQRCVQVNYSIYLLGVRTCKIKASNVTRTLYHKDLQLSNTCTV